MGEEARHGDDIPASNSDGGCELMQIADILDLCPCLTEEEADCALNLFKYR